MKHLFLFSTICLFFTSCISNKRLATLCEQKFPIRTETVVTVRDSFRVDTFRSTEFVKVPVPVTVTIDCPKSDSAKKVTTTTTATADCPKPTVIHTTDIRYVDTTIYKENPYKLNRALNTIDSLNEQLTKKSEEITGDKKHIKQRNHIILAQFGFILLLLVSIRFLKWI